MTRILIVDDETRIVEALARLLKMEGFDPVGAGNGEAALAILEKGGVDAALMDLDMPRKDGLATLAEMRQRGNDLPVIMISGRGTIRTAMDAVKLGAGDFLEKPLDDERVLFAIRQVLSRKRLEEEVEILRADREPGSVVVASPNMKALMDSLDRIARSDSPVLILGETGVGKEVVASRIHSQSGRVAKPLVRLNCAALPETLAESELFGHAKGAFTGAARDHKGRFRLADGGTLFLDEIGELSPPLQAKLLRAVAEGEITPLGSERTEKADVRLIAATNRDLQRLAAEGRFREDLYYRLAVFTVPVPPLRERPDDVAALARHFLSAFARKFARPGLVLESEGEGALKAYPWPGNIRELRSVIERLAVTNPVDRIGSEEVAAALPAAPNPQNPPEAARPTRLAAAVAEEEARFLRKAIHDADGNYSAAARALGLERSHFYRKLKKHGI